MAQRSAGFGWVTKAAKSVTLIYATRCGGRSVDYRDQARTRTASPYFFTSQRSDRLTEAGIHHWLRTLKAVATHAKWDLIRDVTFHDLRHDFAHRARASGWSLEEIAYYLGHVTNKGTPAIQTTIRYTQVSRSEVRDKLRLLDG